MLPFSFSSPNNSNSYLLISSRAPFNTTKKNGTGLGLSIVNKIINDHKGELEFIPIINGAKIQIIFYLNDNRDINS